MKFGDIDLTEFIEHITPKMMAPVRIPMNRRQRAFLHLSRRLPRFISRIFLRAFPSLRIPYDRATWPIASMTGATRLQIFDMSQGGKLIYDGPPNLDVEGGTGAKVVARRDGTFFIPPVMAHPPHEGQQCPECGAIDDSWTE